MKAVLRDPSSGFDSVMHFRKEGSKNSLISKTENIEKRLHIISCFFSERYILRRPIGINREEKLRIECVTKLQNPFNLS